MITDVLMNSGIRGKIFRTESNFQKRSNPEPNGRFGRFLFSVYVAVRKQSLIKISISYPWHGRRNMVVESPNKIHKAVRLFHDLVERGDVIECEKLQKKHNLDVNIPLVSLRIHPF